MRKLLSLILISIIPLVSFGQKKLPVIKANSSKVAIKDGDYLDKNAWSLSPETKPDIYTADRSSKPKWVVFYTDIDSIKVKVKPGTIFDFIILLNGKDTCYTRIVSSKVYENDAVKSETFPDTIPFILNNFDAIQVQSIVNNSDTLNLHFDLGTLDFRFTKPAFSKFRQKKIDKIQMGKCHWDAPNVQIANNASHGMDGRFGWRAFDGKIVEINYDKNILVVHSKLPKIEKDYVRSNIKFIQSLLCIEAAIQIDQKNYIGNFLVDTGSDLAMVLDSAWLMEQHFPENQKVIRKSSFIDGARRKYETTIISIPQVSLNSFKLKNIPTSKLGFKSPVGSLINYFGNELLKRFNMIIDLQKNSIYLKSNTLFSSPYKEKI